MPLQVLAIPSRLRLSPFTTPRLLVSFKLFKPSASKNKVRIYRGSVARACRAFDLQSSSLTSEERTVTTQRKTIS